MNIHEEIEKLKITNELRDEIKVVKEEVTDLECEPYDAIDDQPDYQTLLKQQKDRLELMKSIHRIMSQEIRDYYKKIVEQDEFYIEFPSLPKRVAEDPYLVP